MTGQTEGAATARRALALLEAVCRSPAPVTLDALALGLGLPKSTCYRLLRVLAEELFIERAEGGGYRPGSRFVGLASVAVPQFDSYGAARPILRELADAASETVTLHRRVGMQTVLILGVETTQSLRRTTQIGEATPIYRGAAGLAIMAGLPEDATSTILSVAGGDGQNVDAIVDEINVVRERGYALSFGANHPGLNGLAVSLPVRSQRNAMSVAIAGPEMRWTVARMEAFAPNLRSAVQRLDRLFETV